jgi:hypothetical protein
MIRGESKKRKIQDRNDGNGKIEVSERRSLIH